MNCLKIIQSVSHDCKVKRVIIYWGLSLGLVLTSFMYQDTVYVYFLHVTCVFMAWVHSSYIVPVYSNPSSCGLFWHYNLHSLSSAYWFSTTGIKICVHTALFRNIFQSGCVCVVSAMLCAVCLQLLSTSVLYICICLITMHVLSPCSFLHINVTE